MGRKSSGRAVLLVSLVLFAAVLGLVLWGLDSTREYTDREILSQLGESVNRAVMTCFAQEGSYPPTLEYLEENYGLRIDRTRFVVGYDIFAPNIMPEITVVAK